MNKLLKALSELQAESKESFFMAIGSVVAHKLRSALTLLGILVGVFSIIVVMTAMRAMQKKVQSDLNQFGGQTFVVQTWPLVQFEGPGGMQKYWRRQRLSMDQGRAVVSRASLANAVGLELNMFSGQMISSQTKGPPNVPVLGETPGSFAAKNWTIDEGRALQDSDVAGERDVCVLGNSLAHDLFPIGSGVGEKIMINSIKYTVIGVLEAQGTMSGGNQDKFVIIPVTTGWTRYRGRRWEDLTILVAAQNAAMYDDTVDQVRGILRLARKVPPGKEDDFEIFSNDSMMAQMESFTFKLRLGITLISSIALIAAGIGIMNIMLVSVTERTREIGIRRAIGAKKRSIMVQFIMEAIVLCEIGGVMGVGLGIIGGNVAAHFLKMEPVIPFDWAAIGLGVCSLVGLIFGTYPAYKAANLDPIESLRYE